MNGIYTKKFTGIFVCLTIVIMSGVNIISTMSITFDTMLYIFFDVLPLALAMGFLGYLMGNILDHPKNLRRKNRTSAKA